MWVLNFGNCQSVSWKVFLKVAQGEVERISKQTLKLSLDSNASGSYARYPLDSLAESSDSSLPSTPNPYKERRRTHEGGKGLQVNRHESPLHQHDDGHGTSWQGNETVISKQSDLPDQGSATKMRDGSSSCASATVSSESSDIEISSHLHEIFTPNLPLHRVLRYTLLEPQRQEMEAASGVTPHPYPPISFRSYERYIARFGPSFHVACARAALTCFSDDNVVAPWFHGSMSRSEGDKLIYNSERGSFLVRFSETNPACMTLAYKGSGKRCKNIMIFNLGTW